MSVHFLELYYLNIISMLYYISSSVFLSIVLYQYYYNVIKQQKIFPTHLYRGLQLPIGWTALDVPQVPHVPEGAVGPPVGIVVGVEVAPGAGAVEARYAELVDVEAMQSFFQSWGFGVMSQNQEFENLYWI